MVGGNFRCPLLAYYLVCTSNTEPVLHFIFMRLGKDHCVSSNALITVYSVTVESMWALTWKQC
jgi:hypothetical protein